MSSTANPGPCHHALPRSYGSSMTERAGAIHADFMSTIQVRLGRDRSHLALPQSPQAMSICRRKKGCYSAQCQGTVTVYWSMQGACSIPGQRTCAITHTCTQTYMHTCSCNRLDRHVKPGTICARPRHHMVIIIYQFSCHTSSNNSRLCHCAKSDCPRRTVTQGAHLSFPANSSPPLPSL